MYVAFTDQIQLYIGLVWMIALDYKMTNPIAIGLDADSPKKCWMRTDAHPYIFSSLQLQLMDLITKLPTSSTLDGLGCNMR